MSWFLACSVPFSVSSAQAEEHIIIILGSAYFPKNTAVEDGDTVRFVNQSGQSHTVMHADGVWNTRPIAEGGELLVRIEDGMAGLFYGQADQRISGQLDQLRDPLTDHEVR